MTGTRLNAEGSALSACEGCSHQGSEGCQVLELVYRMERITNPRAQEIVRVLLNSGAGPIARSDVLPDDLELGDTVAARNLRFAKVMEAITNLPLLSRILRKEGERGGRRYFINGSALVELCGEIDKDDLLDLYPIEDVHKKRTAANHGTEPNSVKTALDEQAVMARLNLVGLVRDWVLGRQVDARAAREMMTQLPKAELDAVVAQGKYYALNDELYNASALPGEQLRQIGRFEASIPGKKAENPGQLGERVILGIVASVEEEQANQSGMSVDTHHGLDAGIETARNFDDEAKGWQDFGNCLGVDPDLFFPERGASTRQAKEVCRGCLVREECLEYALANGEKFGIWGGLSERERRRIRRQRAQARRAVEAAKADASTAAD